jgi:hypothetical protein
MIGVRPVQGNAFGPNPDPQGHCITSRDGIQVTRPVLVVSEHGPMCLVGTAGNGPRRCDEQSRPNP